MRARPSTAASLLRFLVVGGSCYLLNLLLLVLGVELLGLDHRVAFVLALVLMVFIGHFLNRRWTFRSDGAYGPELLRFMATIGTQAALGMGAIWLLVERAGLHYVVANVVATAVLTAASFVVQRFAVFRPSRPAAAPAGRDPAGG